MRNVLEYVEQSAKEYPTHIAVIDEKQSLTYQSLLIQAQRCGSGLTFLHQSKKPYAVFMDKSIYSLISFFGIVYSGNFYVLLNPELPEERLIQIMKVLDNDIIITDDFHYHQAKQIFPKERIYLIENLIKSEISNEELEAIRRKCCDIDPLYANFTSGSTGIPKGVVVSQRSVIDFIDVFCEIFQFKHVDVFANQAPFDFDVSVKDIYSSMKKGATLVLISRKLFSRPTALLDFLCEKEVTTMIWAVSALCLITTFHGFDYKIPQKVTKILFSGEVMPMKHLKIWMEHLPNATFVNLYGPTEVTCNCTYHIIDTHRDYKDQIPIGIAFPNEDVFLLDEQNKLVEEGQIGEICVRGSTLALGYYNADEQSKKQFVRNPLNPYYNEIIYRTGDLGKIVHNEFYFCGRKDFQIKHMGHRIELEEIEKAMNQLSSIKRSCCIYEQNKIYGFYIGKIEKKEIIQQLKKTLPIYMIPNRLKQVEEMPLNKNGKIDRKKLMENEK
ncbi:MAG: amino acid adenylation domain-containing protein [Traorella sp.]